MADAVAPAPRERGWRRLFPALLLFLFVPAVPLFRALVPVEQTLILIAPAMAAIALVGWWSGGRVVLAVLWLALAVWVIASAPSGAASFDMLSRGWALLLAASFGAVSVLGPQRSFFPRALSATGISFALALAVLLLTAASPVRLGRSVEGEFERRVESSFTSWNALSQTKEWSDFARQNPGAAKLAEEGEKQLREIPRLSARIFPALLALESLAALALVWGLFHRVSRTRVGPPLSPLRDFRFSDQLVWGLVAGVTVLVLPTLATLRTVGLNLIVFFGALYALRGLGVLTWFLAPGRLTMMLFFAMAIFIWPVLGIFALGIGLGDTWLDWRSRPRPTT